MDADYFFDTYAIIEIVEGSENYREYSNKPIITSLYNIYEFTYYILREYKRGKAEEVLDKLNYNIIRPKQEHLFPATELKLDNKGQQLSYVDCMGYQLAKENDLKFLTGDIEFKNKENVEYVD